MKLTALLAAISLSSLIAAAPVTHEDISRRGKLPTAMDAVDMIFPHSGIPQVASKLRQKLNLVCQHREMVGLY